jgi:hypothetical protein
MARLTLVRYESPARSPPGLSIALSLVIDPSPRAVRSAEPIIMRELDAARGPIDELRVGGGRCNGE